MSGSDKSINPGEYVPNDALEWDFSDVPDAELAVCRLWEYARESVSMRSLCERTQEAAHGKLRGASERELVRREFYAIFNYLGRASILFQEGVYGFGGTAYAEKFQTPFPLPWRRLSIEQRSVLCETVNWDVREFTNISPFRRAQLPHVKALAEFKPQGIKVVFGKESVSAHDFFQRRRETPPDLPQLSPPRWD